MLLKNIRPSYFVTMVGDNIAASASQQTRGGQ
jgi:hypothetical protein